MRKKISLVLLSFLFTIVVIAQSSSDSSYPSRQDSLKGSNTPERAWWDVLHYNLNIQPDLINRNLTGENTITYRVVKSNAKLSMQIDLQPPLHIDSIALGNQKLSFHRDGNAWFINVPPQTKNSTHHILIFYSGKPKENARPPWDGGFVWAKDSLGRPWVSVACEELGASIWYPCKVHLGDEPNNGASITIAAPDTLVAVGNGRLQKQKNNSDGTISYTWSVVSPINNYDISFYMGKYVNISEKYEGEKGMLDMSYWVLDYNIEKAQGYLRGEVQKTIKTFEHWFGPYPFYNDGFKMVEAPYVGMEHQSAIAYGNGFRLGRIRSSNLTTWDYKTDRLVVHETAHEWFGNNISAIDFTDRWLHEGLAGYAEELFIEAQYGRNAAEEFFIDRPVTRISNKEPVIRRYDIFEDAGPDMYLKGWAIAHMLRAIVNDDEKFRQILRGLNRKFYHHTVSSKQIEAYICKKAGRDLSSFFDQYLRSATKPVLEYKLEGQKVKYRFSNCVEGFSMPVKISSVETRWLVPTTRWKKVNLNNLLPLTVEKDFYIDVKDVSSLGN